MKMKFEMTRRGMESLYLMAWRQGAKQQQVSGDPMYSGYGAEEGEEAPDTEALLLEETLVAPGRVAPLEAAVRADAYAQRELDSRERHLLWLGYAGV